jgi:hypothetical protein
VNISAALFPLAATAAEHVVRQVGEVVQCGTTFARLLAAGAAGTAADAADAGQVPEVFEPDVASALRRRQTDLQALDAETAAVQRLLLAWCAAHGVPLEEPIVIRADADQRLLVDNARPDRSVIEEMLAAQSDLALRLRHLFAQAQSVHAAPDATAADRQEVRLVLEPQQAVWAVA